MSTSYYKVREGYRIDCGAERPIERWYVIHARTGQVVASVDPDHLHILADRDEKAAHRGGGTITVYATGPDSEWVLSAYGEPVTLGDLRRGVAP